MSDPLFPNLILSGKLFVLLQRSKTTIMVSFDPARRALSLDIQDIGIKIYSSKKLIMDREVGKNGEATSKLLPFKS